MKKKILSIALLSSFCTTLGLVALPTNSKEAFATGTFRSNYGTYGTKTKSYYNAATKAEEKETTEEATTTSTETKETTSSSDSKYDPIEYYSPDNPKKFSPYPQKPDLSNLVDNSAQGLEKERKQIMDYLKETYPNHEFKLINLISYKYKEKTVVQTEAFSKDSVDFIIWVRIIDGKIVDTLKEDVIERINTFNRFNRESFKLMDAITTKYYPLEEALADISYSEYRENISKVKLDEIIDHRTTTLNRSIGLTIKKPEPKPEEVSKMANELFKAIDSEGFKAKDYYIYMVKGAQPNVTKFFFKIPKELIGSSDFEKELIKAMNNPDDKDNKITPLPNNGELVK